MKKKHLFWIIPLTLIFGFMVGFKSFEYLTDNITDMLTSVDECCINVMTYTQDMNKDCDILITGKMRECYLEKQLRGKE